MDYKSLEEVKEQYSELLKRLRVINHNDDYTERKIKTSKEIKEKIKSIDSLIKEVECYPGEFVEREEGFLLESVNKPFSDLCDLLDLLEREVVSLENKISNGEEV